MIKTFTPNDVLNYFYNEVSKLEKENIEDFLVCNDAMREFYCDLIRTDEIIEENLIKPSQKSVNNILNYSKSLCLQN